jgi:hypothetical protein
MEPSCIYFEVLDSKWERHRDRESDKIKLQSLAPVTMSFRIRGNVTKAVDFTIKVSSRTIDGLFCRSSVA